MALSAKREGFKHVPWFSLQEWLQVYSQIYSNDAVEQDKGYKTLLVWKARIPKLPVGVECTLGLIQVCLRDRELTLQIDNAELPVFYENDLCLMYSTTIMRFLNHISNVRHTKQGSLFEIAKQLEIPEWIVNLRHDTAHGHELPSLSTLRLAANMLLTWLHDEYWASEANNMEKFLTKQMEVTEEEESGEAEALKDLMELWIAVGLYVQANYSLVDDIPDNQLQNVLQDLRTFTLNLSEGKIQNSPSVSAFRQINSRESNSTTSVANEETGPDDTEVKSDKKFHLSTARGILLSEISRYLGKNKSIANKKELVLNFLLETEVFLPKEDILEIFTNERTSVQLSEDDLPLDMIHFWQDFILLLQETKMLQSTILGLLKLIDDSTEERYRKEMAALWIKVIIRGVLKMKVSQNISETLQHSLDKKNKRISSKLMSLKIRDKINHLHPNLKNDLTLNILGDIPNCLTSLEFVTDLVLNVNKYSAKFIPMLLDLVSPSIEKDQKQLLLELVQIYIGENIVNGDTSANDKGRIYTIEDFEEFSNLEENQQEDMETDDTSEQTERVPKILDQTIRNTNWKLASANYDWSSCPIGILPWQLDNMESLIPLTPTTPVKEVRVPTTDVESKIVPGMIDTSILKMRSNINWDEVFSKRKRTKRKRQKGKADVIIDRAMEIVKKHH